MMPGKSANPFRSSGSDILQTSQFIGDID